MGTAIISGLEKYSMYLRVATIRGMRMHTFLSAQGEPKVDEASVSTALCMGTMSTSQCGFSFWERLWRLERLLAHVLHKLS